MRNALILIALSLSLMASRACAADSRPIQSETVWTFEYDGTSFSALTTTGTGSDLTTVYVSAGGGGGEFTGDAFDVTYTATTESDWVAVPANAGDALDELASRTSAVEIEAVNIMPPTPTALAVPVINEDADALTQVDLGYSEVDGNGRMTLGASGVEHGGTHYDYGIWMQASDDAASPALGIVTSFGSAQTVVQFSTSGPGGIIPCWDFDMNGHEIRNLGGFKTALIASYDFAETALSVSGIDMETDQTANIRAGMLVKITSAGTEYPYRVKSITAGAMRVLGPDINTAASTVSAIEWSGKVDAIGYMQFQVSGNWCDTTSTSLLADDMGVRFQWPLPSGRIVGVCAVERVATGSPVVNVYVNDSAILETGITVGTSWADSEGNLYTGASAVDPGIAVEIGCTSGVASGNADLSVGLWYYLTGNE